MLLKVLFEDSDLLVIDKPPGLVSTPAESEKGLTLADYLTDQFKIELDRGGLVHRLDKDTSGVIVAARNLDSFENLQAQFKDKTIQKTYTALVHGQTDSTGQVEGPIGRNPGDREKFIVTPEGKEATTDYKTLKFINLSEDKIRSIFDEFNKIQLQKLFRSDYGQFSLIECFPKTGRTHQIRVHLKHINHSIVGDSKYGGRKIVRLDHRFCPRQFLHASRIELIHPRTGQKLVVESPLAEDLKNSLAIIEQ